MIRVNLLPIRKARRRSQGRMQLILFGGVIAILVAILAVVHLYYHDQLSQWQEEVEEAEATISELEEETAGIEDLEREAQELSAQLEALNELEARRVGPVQMLDELQAMLSPPRDEEDRVAQLRRDWNVEWDTRRLWISDFQEGDGSFRLNGYAGNADDVAEFLQRMTTAVYFDNVELDYIDREGGDVGLVSFHLRGELSYTGFDDRADGGDDS